MPTFQRQSGVVLVAALMVTMMLFATITVVLNFSVSESEVLDRRLDELEAFYLAEGAIEGAKFEIASNIDTAADGLGSLSGSKTTGSYIVVAVETAGLYELTSTGTATGGSIVTLETTIEFEYETTFPGAAMSFVGDMSALNMEFKKDTNLILHGGSGPALSFSDQGTYQSIGDEFAKAIYDGFLPASNIVGGVTNTFTHASTDYQIPIDHEPNYSTQLQNLSDVYTAFNATADAIASTVTPITQLTGGTYGDANNPVTIYATGESDLDNTSVTGYGTLIIGDRLRINSGCTFDWYGDIFVIGDGGDGGELGVFGGGTMNVTGNVIILGEAGIAGAENEFRVAGSGSQATINGNLVLATDFAAHEGKTSLDIEGSAGLTVNGVLTMMGQEIAIESDGDATNSIIINGMMQLAVPDTGENHDVTLQLDGGLEVYVDTTKIQTAMGLLHDLGVEHDLLPQVNKIVSAGGTITRTWTKQGGGAAGAGGKYAY